MIQDRSIIKIADNSGAKIGRVFKVLGSSKKRWATIGQVVIFSVQKAEPRKQVKKKDILYGFDENAVVVIEKGKKDPIAGRVFGPIPREISELGFQKIASLAPEIV